MHTTDDARTGIKPGTPGRNVSAVCVSHQKAFSKSVNLSFTDFLQISDCAIAEEIGLYVGIQCENNSFSIPGAG